MQIKQWIVVRHLPMAQFLKNYPSLTKKNDALGTASTRG